MRLAACGDRHGEGLKQKAEEDSGRCDRPQLPLCTGKKDDDEHNCGEGQQISLKRHPIEPAECDARGSALMARRAQAEGKLATQQAAESTRMRMSHTRMAISRSIQRAVTATESFPIGAAASVTPTSTSVRLLGIIPDLQHRVIGL